MSQVASTSADSQEKTSELVNAVVQQPKTQRFQLANQAFDVRMVGTLEDPWFVAKDIGKVLGIHEMKDHLRNYKKGTEKGEGGLQSTAQPQSQAFTLISV
jgi:prophage antirepressor-like protein